MPCIMAKFYVAMKLHQYHSENFFDTLYYPRQCRLAKTRTSPKGRSQSRSRVYHRCKIGARRFKPVKTALQRAANGNGQEFWKQTNYNTGYGMNIASLPVGSHHSPSNAENPKSLKLTTFSLMTWSTSSRAKVEQAVP